MSDYLDYVNTPDELKENVTICGHEIPLKEFTQAERHLWLSTRDDSDLNKLVEEFNDLREDVETRATAMLEVYNKREEKLVADIDKLISSTTDWTDKAEAKAQKIAEEIESIREKRDEIEKPQNEALLEKAPELTKRLNDLRDTQQTIYLGFVYDLLTMRGDKHEGTKEEFVAEAKGSDRLAAEEVVEQGNFMWEAQPNRKARRAAARSRIAN